MYPLGAARARVRADNAGKVHAVMFDNSLTKAEAEDAIAYQVGPRAHGKQERHVAHGYLNLVNPHTGVAVVFTPGEALPDWAVDAVS